MHFSSSPLPSYLTLQAAALSEKTVRGPQLCLSALGDCSSCSAAMYPQCLHKWQEKAQKELNSDGKIGI